MHTIKRATCTIKGDNSECIFVRIMLLFFLLRFFYHHQALNSCVLAPIFGALVYVRWYYVHILFIILGCDAKDKAVQSGLLDIDGLPPIGRLMKKGEPFYG